MKEEDHEQDNENMNHLDADERTSTDEKGNRIFENKVNYDRSESESESSDTKFKSPHDPFRMLRFLNVNGTLLSTWDEVERLARFPALKSLRIQGCPLFEVSRSSKIKNCEDKLDKLENILILHTCLFNAC